jgi:hypothetical protein
MVAAGMATAAAGTAAAATADIAQVSLPSPPEESSNGFPPEGGREKDVWSEWDAA